MLKKQNRLAKAKEIEAVFARGRGFFSPLFTIRFIPNRLGDPRFTIIVSTKVFKKATKRNRLKRILCEFIRLRLNQFYPGDYAVVLKPKPVQTEEQTLIQLFHQLLLKSKLLKP